MLTIEKAGIKGTSGVKKLREQKLRGGQAFMINVKDLPTYQFYLEYPDGSMHLMDAKKDAKDLTFIRTLTPQEASSIRLRFKFSPIK
ncbi:MAG TPA: hypothetical protein VG738_19265 [Chitinophagaceae bacterium]|nr:hypothetical protein [Chitinophagaceae bacterium]